MTFDTGKLGLFNSCFIKALSVAGKAKRGPILSKYNSNGRWIYRIVYLLLSYNQHYDGEHLNTQTAAYSWKSIIWANRSLLPEAAAAQHRKFQKIKIKMKGTSSILTAAFSPSDNRWGLFRNSTRRLSAVAWHNSPSKSWSPLPAWDWNYFIEKSEVLHHIHPACISHTDSSSSSLRWHWHVIRGL